MAEYLQQVKAVWSGFAGAPGTSTWYFRDVTSFTGHLSSASLTTGVAAMRQFFNACASQLAASVTISWDGTAKEIDAATGTLYGYTSYTAPSAVTGTGSSSVAAPAGASVSWRTTSVVNGRSLRGRTFLVPLYAGAYEADGSLNSTFLTQCRAAAAAYATASSTATTWVGCVWHRPGPSGVGVVGDISSSAVKDEVAVLRSRRN
jgi:hypothetical protein